ncbi:MAG: hypothetical protein KJZ47_13905 [Gemmatimonadales bacterium]|nr:hypothetical protein [Gemmatimonadales bacterium]
MTAPHGPSEELVDLMRELLHNHGLARADDPRNAEVGRILATCAYAEARVAVVAECVAVAHDEEAKRGTETDAGAYRVECRLRALLPPVSAPGPTLPGEWTVATAENQGLPCLEAVHDGVWGHAVVRLFGGLVVTASIPFSPRMPIADLQAVLAYLASRAERGPDAGGEG